MNEVLHQTIGSMGVLGIILQLIFLECILSIDNAAVMGAMVAHLPDNQPVPWSPRWRSVLSWSDRLLGAQRSAALKVGLFGAYAGRVLLLLLASLIIRWTWMQVLGTLYLLHLGSQHFVQHYLADRQRSEDGDAAPRFAGQRGFWSVVLALNLADLAFSLDNVVAAIALSEQLWVVIAGVGIGIVIIRFSATVFAKLIAWEPQLESAAYLLLLAIGSEVLLDTLLGIHTAELTKFALSISILLLTVAFARIASLQPLLCIVRPVVAMLALVQVGAERLVAAGLALGRQG